jgi:putative membrane protein
MWWHDDTVAGSGGPDEDGPDYQLSLSAERTYLAYIRTALALLAGGVAAVGVLPDMGQLRLRRAIGVLLVLGGLYLAVVARRRWRTLDDAMRQRLPLPTSLTSLLVSAAMVGAGVLALVLVVVI